MTMRIEPAEVRALVITGADELDAINVFLQDTDTCKGRLVVECFGSVWTAYWNAMDGDLIHFLSEVDVHYMANKLTAQRRLVKREQGYLLRICTAVKAACQKLRAEREVAA